MPYPAGRTAAPDTTEFTEEKKGSTTKAFRHLTPHYNCPKNPNYPHSIKGETEAQRWPLPVLGPTEYEAAQAWKEKSIPALSFVEGGFASGGDLLHCPRYSAHNTDGRALPKCQHLKTKRYKPASPSPTRALKMPPNPSAQLLPVLPAYDVLKDVSGASTSSVFSRH